MNHSSNQDKNILLNMNMNMNTLEDELNNTELLSMIELPE